MLYIYSAFVTTYILPFSFAAHNYSIANLPPIFFNTNFNNNVHLDQQVNKQPTISTQQQAKIAAAFIAPFITFHSFSTTNRPHYTTLPPVRIYAAVTWVVVIVIGQSPLDQRTINSNSYSSSYRWQSPPPLPTTILIALFSSPHASRPPLHRVIHHFYQPRQLSLSTTIHYYYSAFQAHRHCFRHAPLPTHHRAVIYHHYSLFPTITYTRQQIQRCWHISFAQAPGHWRDRCSRRSRTSITVVHFTSNNRPNLSLPTLHNRMDASPCLALQVVASRYIFAIDRLSAAAISRC